MRQPSCTCQFTNPGAHYEQCPFYQWLLANPEEMKAWKERVRKAETARLANRTSKEKWRDYLSANDMGPYGGR